MSSSLPWLDPETVVFPDPATALRKPNGLLAVGGDLRSERLLSAYSQGIFPWFEEGQPPLWWSPDPRMVLFPDEFHCSRSLGKMLRSNQLRLTTDRAFQAVMQGCAAPRATQPDTWITDAMLSAYLELHQLGYAHSLEVWQDEELVGGIYGIALQKVFFGESMFSKVSNASKLAMAWLVSLLRHYGFELIDCQVSNPHLESLGARNIPRGEFSRYLPGPGSISSPPRWPVELPPRYQDLMDLKLAQS